MRIATLDLPIAGTTPLARGFVNLTSALRKRVRSSRVKDYRYGSLSFLVATAVAPATAHADIPWDANVSFGTSRRLLEDSYYGQGRVGGRVAADAHITTLRVVRVGLGGYAELSPYEDFGARRFFGAGLRLGARIPVPTERVRFFVGTGLNYVGVVAPEKEYAIVRPSYTVEGTLVEAGGRMLEVPLTLGVALPLARDFHLLFQGGASMSFAQSGSYYDSPSTFAEGPIRMIRSETGSLGGIGGGGIDTFAWFATLGLMFEAPR